MTEKLNMAVFDMDGTLYRSETSFIEAVKTVLSNNRLETPPEEFLFSFIGEPDSVFAKWLEDISNPGKALELYDEFQTRELEMVREKGELYEGVLPLLYGLKDFTLAICSNATDIYIKTVVEKFKIDKLFSALRVPVRGESKKQMLRDLEGEFKPSGKFMVGDRYHDMAAAEENGFVFVAALYGYGRDEIESSRFAAEKPEQIKRIIDSILKA
ncbi:HAD family hydrolase [candidate division WOR-3 bacterium]|nr:HAD family hydrolase [candidate division WOR-3 bacterium]